MAGAELQRAEARIEVQASQELLSRRRRSDRIWRLGPAAVALALVTAAFGTVLTWETSRFVLGDVACAVVLLLALTAMVSDLLRNRGLPSRTFLEEDLAVKQDSLRQLNAKGHPSLAERRRLYREDVAGIIELYQRKSRKYRRTHNSLQSLVMVGSTTTTTVGALDTARELTWQSVTIVSISFVVTLAAMFTGYYKYRERGYFLQQTADAIEEHANAVALGVGEYSKFDTGQEEEALARFTQRVEELRNEQRRRQQQLDQSADQTAPIGQPPA